MKALNIFLAVAVSLVMGIGVLEGGLRLLGFGPPVTINEFDPILGWTKRPGTDAKRSGAEFEVTMRINAAGLRDDPNTTGAKPEGTFRVLMLGDSFVLGYTVDRDDLFVDHCERFWLAEGRSVDVVNAGTEGYSTDQEVLWFDAHGAAFEPDLVLLFPYENDLFWNGQRTYGRNPKPRFRQNGGVEERSLEDPGERGTLDRFAATRWLGGKGGGSAPDPASWETPGGHTLAGAELEWAVYFKDAPEFVRDAEARTRAALEHLASACRDVGARLVVAPIPNKAVVDPDGREALEKKLPVDPDLWSPDRPVDVFLRLADELRIEKLDVRPTLAAHYAAGGDALYFRSDWHFNPEGNRVFARFLTAELADDFPNAFAAQPGAVATISGDTPDAEGWPTWAQVFLGLWAALGTLYAYTYRSDESPLRSYLQVGGLLALVFSIVLGGDALLAKLPPSASRALLIVFLFAVLGFVAWKLGRRLGTIGELLTSFVKRGHWYLMPLVVVLLTVGSLLVVAASSPLAAPFIYTLF